MSLFLAAALLVLAPEADARRDPVPYEGDFLVPDDARELTRFCRQHNAVTGDLIVGKAWTATDLTRLACVERIGGRLVIKQTEKLLSLEGLRLSQQAGVPLRAIRIVDNASLTDVGALSAMEGLRTAGLVVQGNLRLTKLLRLPPVVGGAHVTVADNRSLVSLHVPDGARSGTGLGPIYIANNPHLESITGMGRVVSAESVAVRAVPRLRELNTLPNLRTTGRIELVGLPLLETWSLGPRLSTMEHLVIEDVDGMKVLPAMPALVRAVEIRIEDNDLLESIAGLTVARGGHPSVDRLVVHSNPRLPQGDVLRVVDRLHLSAGENALTIEGNLVQPAAHPILPGAPHPPPPGAVQHVETSGD